MGLLGKLFGKSGPEESGGEDRCNECGMTGGRHTEWCPEVQEAAPVEPRHAGPAETPTARPTDGP